MFFSFIHARHSILPLCLLCFSSVSLSDEIEKATRETHALQQQIAKLNATLRDLTFSRAQYETYIQHQQAILLDQSAQIEKMQQSLNQDQDTKITLIPLIYQQLTQMKDWQQQDLPIQLHTREKQRKQVQQALKSASFNEVEKFDGFLSLLLDEIQLGQKKRVYVDQVNIDGISRWVEILQFGRLSLIARSPDHAAYWRYNSTLSDWERLPEILYSNLAESFDDLLQARKVQTIDLPLSVLQAPTLATGGGDK